MADEVRELPVAFGLRIGAGRPDELLEPGRTREGNDRVGERPARRLAAALDHLRQKLPRDVLPVEVPALVVPCLEIGERHLMRRRPAGELLVGDDEHHIEVGVGSGEPVGDRAADEQGIDCRIGREALRHRVDQPAVVWQHDRHRPCLSRGIRARHAQKTLSAVSTGWGQGVYRWEKVG